MAPSAAERADIVVSEAESGRKLLQFLQYRLSLPPTLLHRWIRSGQVRLNGGRCKPFTRVQTGYVVRLPPFAHSMSAQSTFVRTIPSSAAAADAPLARQSPSVPPDPSSHSPSGLTRLPAPLPPPPPLVDSAGDILAFHKPAGLPTHPGTGHSDSLSSRLAATHAQAFFKPTPVHRLDKDTSGILLVATTFTALRQLQEWMHDRLIGKEYVAWVHGAWPFAEARLLRDHLGKAAIDGQEKVHCLPEPHDNDHFAHNKAKEALCLVRPLLVRQHESLLLIRLFTGRTHQIRVQLAERGHAILGDFKYGLREGAAASGQSKKNHGSDKRMYLHSLRITLPNGRSFACLPNWDTTHALAEMPAPAPLSAGDA